MPNVDVELPEPELTLLIVDDDEDTRSVLADCFLSEGVNTPVASRGLDALAQVEANIPDAILLDIRMPGLDGFEVLRRLQADPKTEGIPVVLFTAESIERLDSEIRTSGCAAFLRKPCAFDELLATVRRVVSTHAASGIRSVSREDSSRRAV